MNRDFRYVRRNPRPASGPGILTLDQIRHYVRAFKTDPRYGLAGLEGGFRAWRRYVYGSDSRIKQQFIAKILAAEPTSEYLSAPLQRLFSRKIRAVLNGEIVFHEHNGVTRWGLPEGRPQPLAHVPPPFRTHRFRLERTIIGPKVRRLAGEF